MKKFVSRILLPLMACLMLVACGAPSSLEEILTSDAAVAETEKAKEDLLSQYSDTYSDYAMEVTGNNLTYKYYYVEELSASADDLKAALEAESSWSDLINQTKDEIEKTAKIRPETVTFAYYTADGTEIFSVTE
ncbi:hypothetical protein SAMN02910275_00077 [Butyrivibrio sp. INlla18]|uniref:hypothetical protein n=1 Tax=Butyrivibrio sp. INlla18 TaxID=1520806 RepID=UPI0008835948|nr:hypothetical protein [Butyrivibrio sp. INlla18]SDA38219.1 hypothetical protein SAMN02910275_00077 [Butyrivibrio sp. INlla18]